MRCHITFQLFTKWRTNFQIMNELHVIDASNPFKTHTQFNGCVVYIVHALLQLMKLTNGKIAILFLSFILLKITHPLVKSSKNTANTSANRFQSKRLAHF